MKHQILSESVELKKISEKDNVGVFTVDGLYTGYGLTIGNSLRRVLLSSLPGAAVTQIKIKGVEHEFSTLPGMTEDIVEFTLNLKKIRFKMLTDEPQTIILKAHGEKEVTAGNIKTTAFIEVVNPELHLATLTKKNSELDMELIVEKGLGYVPAEHRQIERLPIGTVVLDAIFSPVKRVDFDVENMRVGERTDYNRIKLEIETDSTISPSAALHKATSILRDHFDKIYSSVALETPKSTPSKNEDSNEDQKDENSEKIKTKKKSKK